MNAKVAADLTLAGSGAPPATHRQPLHRRSTTTDTTATDRSRLPTVVIVGFFLVGVLLRVWVLRSSLGDADSDEAITGLMAMHFREGEFSANGQLAVFYWGATYAGTFEPILTAVVFLLAGPSVIGLKAVPIGLTALGAFLIWRAAREYFGPGHGPLESAVFWVFPAGTLLLLMKAQVVYASGVCFIVGLLLLALRMAREPRPYHFFLFGLLAGLGLWATPLTLATIVPIGLVALASTWRRGAVNLLAVPGALIGAAPWLWYSVRSGWVTLQQVGTVESTYWERLKGCLAELYPLLLGLRRPVTLAWVLPHPVGPLVYVVLLAALVGVPIYRYRARVLPIVVPVVVFPFVYALSTTSWYTAEPRHGTLIAPLMLMLAVSLVPRVAIAQLVTFVVVVAMTVSSLDYVRDLGEANTDLATVRPGKLQPVLDTMERQGLNACYADYWIAYRVTFESEEDIICSAYWGDRYPPYRHFADENGARTYLFIRDTAQSDSFRERLVELQVPFSAQEFETVDMFVLDEPRRPQDIQQCVNVPWVDEPTCPR